MDEQAIAIAVSKLPLFLRPSEYEKVSVCSACHVSNKMRRWKYKSGGGFVIGLLTFVVISHEYIHACGSFLVCMPHSRIVHVACHTPSSLHDVVCGVGLLLR